MTAVPIGMIRNILCTLSKLQRNYRDAEEDTVVIRKLISEEEKTERSVYIFTVRAREYRVFLTTTIYRSKSRINNLRVAESLDLKLSFKFKKYEI